MKILVANLGSTSFKYSVFDMKSAHEERIAIGRIERIGSEKSSYQCEINAHEHKGEKPIADHAAALELAFSQLTENGINASEIAAIGFKAVLSSRFHNVHYVTEELLESMTEMNDVMPAHNPPYVKAMRELKRKFPALPLVAAFETDFHTTIPDRNRRYGVPYEWAEKHSILRFGFHGASHRYIASRTAELLQRSDLRIISCHLGGSSSICAIESGKSRATSMGSSAQTGLFQNNRVGDFDPFVIPYLMKRLGVSHQELIKILSEQSGLLGLSGVSSDMRDVLQAAEYGNAQAKLAIDVYVGDIRKYIGAYIVELGGADAIVFTGGIGENQTKIREYVCRNLEQLGIGIEVEKNSQIQSKESPVHSKNSRTQIWVVPTNEELIVARQTMALVCCL